MPDVAIYMQQPQARSSAGKFMVAWVAIESSTDLIASSQVDVNYSDNPSTINNTVIANVVAVYAPTGITILPSDKKILFGAAS